MRAGLAKQPGVEDLQGGNPGSNTGEPAQPRSLPLFISDPPAPMLTELIFVVQ